MEVKRDEMTDEKWEEMRMIAKRNVCAECGADLQVHTVPDRAVVRVGCLNQEHHGYVERETYTKAFRRGQPIHPAIQSAIEKKMMPKDDLGRAMNLLALRYPDAITDQATASLFIMDCARLDIDPLIQPAEAVPVPFKRRIKKDGGFEERVTIQMIITKDGWLSMAARGCKEDWVGPPRTMRLEDYLMALPEHKGRPLEELQKIAQDIKRSACKDPEAWYYVAIGRRRAGEETVVPGWFTHNDLRKAEKLPAFESPGNQAATRAIKHWVREVFPDCRQRMMELTAEWYRRAEGIKAAEEFIDAEYSLIAEGGEETDVPGAAKGRGKESAAVSSPPKAKPKKSEFPAAAEAEGEGFSIDLEWLRECMKVIKWSEDTAKSWLQTKYKIDTEGSLADVLKRLTREQAKEFVQEIQDRAAQLQMHLGE